MRTRRNLSDVPRISWDRVVAFRLSRHHLAKRAPAGSMARVAGDMAGVQAQIMSAAQMALGTRIHALRSASVERALWRDRTLAKVWCMRGTVHLIPSNEFGVFVQGCARRGARTDAWMTRAGLPVDRIDRLVEAAANVIDYPLTRTEVAERLRDDLGLTMRHSGGRGWGGPANAPGFDLGGSTVSVGGILGLACMRGLACSGPSRGNEATFVRPDSWLPRWKEWNQEDAEAELLRRYLQAHGPATVADFAMWTYMTSRDAREIWSRLETELSPVNVAGRIGWVLRADLGLLMGAKVERPLVRLLPYFDSFLLGHKEKGHLVDAAHYKRVYRAAGWLSPVVLLDGHVAGVWSYKRQAGRLGVRVEPFGPFTDEVKSLVTKEAEDLARFLDLDRVRVTFSKPN